VHTTATPASAAAFGAAAPAAAPAPAAPAAVLEDPGVPAEVMAREASDRLVEELLQLDDVSAMSR
jgi:predicted methyltransferase